MKVYVTHSGEYSSRETTGVFSTEDKARVESDDIEEFELDAKVPPPGKVSFMVVIMADETVARVEALGYESAPRVQTGGWFHGWTQFMEGKDYLVVTCWAVSADHAVKIAAEKLAEYLYSAPPSPT